LEKALGQFVQSHDQNLGHLEVQIAQKARELLRPAAAAGVQQKADATPPLCPVCQKKLSRLTHGQPRTFDTPFGSVTVQRTRGYGKRCRKWRAPAATALGLEDTAGYSPVVQEMAAVRVSKMPVSEASVVLQRLTGVKLPRATLDREARRQGRRAEELRGQLDKKAATTPPPAPARKQLELTLEPYPMILQMDAWNIRERDDWRKSAALRRRGKEPERWHGVYTGTCFRLDHRAQTAGGRPVLVERGFVATRSGLEGLRRQLHARGHAARLGAGRQRPGHRRRGGVDMAPSRRPVPRGSPTAGLLSRGATSGGGGPRGVWRRPGKIENLAQTPGSAIEKPIGHQSHPATGRGAGRIARRRCR
jgi:hypothetical protein